MHLFINNLSEDTLIKRVILVNIIFLLWISVYFDNLSYSQWIIPPMPSPLPNASICCTNNINKSDIKPPQITIATEKLFEGNNVLKLKILDDSPLKKRGLNYTMGNNMVTTYLAKEHNNEYRALVKVYPPSSKIIVTAVDTNDNVARLVKVLEVKNGFGNLIENFTNLNFWKNLIFGDFKN
jgi:hypothetical protein